MNIIHRVTILVILECLMLHSVSAWWRRIRVKPKPVIKEIPVVGDANPMVNLGKEKALGQVDFLSSFVKESNYKTTVFKIKMERERIILSDPVAVNVMFDTRKVYKVPEIGPITFNPSSTRGYVTSFVDNGKSHFDKKKRQYDLIKERLYKFGLLGIFKIMGQELGKIDEIKSDTAVPFSDMLDKVTQNTMVKYLLGKPLNDVTLFRSWFGISFKINPALDPKAAEKEPLYKKIADQMFSFIESTPVVEDFTDKCEFENDHLKAEKIFLTMWLSAAGVVNAQKKIMREYFNLPEADRESIQREATYFFQENKNLGFFEANVKNHNAKVFDYSFKMAIPRITRFALETVRLFSPVQTISARARQDFVLKSLNGNYQIKKDDYLFANIISSMRNPSRLQNADKFDMNRNPNTIKNNFFAFGGPYHQKATYTNHKCPGQQLAIDFMKMFVLHLTRCDVKLSSPDPLAVTEFSYKPIKEVCKA